MNQTSEPLITDTLTTLHRRVGLGFVYLQAQRHNPTLFERGRVRLTDIVTRHYLPALRAMLAEHGREAVVAQHAHVEGRLNVGASLLGASASRRVDDAYIALVVEYEILSDALRVGQQPDSYLTGVFDRIDGIQHRPVVAVTR